MLFDSVGEAVPWIILRHTGANAGAGLVRWDADEINRFQAKHAQRKRTLAGQILDFINEHKLLEGRDVAQPAITTTLQRVVNTPEVRDVLGIETVNGDLVSRYPIEEVAKGLVKIVDDLRSGRINVNDVRNKQQRLDYIEGFKKKERPDPKKELGTTTPLADLSPAPGAPPPAPPPRKRRRRAPQPRTTVIPRDTTMDPAPPRINAIFNELLNLSMAQYPNACAVLLRVFLDLSVDHALEEAGIMSEQQRLSTQLAKRMKDLAEHMVSTGEITVQIRRAVYKAADAGAGPLSASARTFNQYVHNRHVHPSPADLRAAWDELQPFLEKVWP